jgi:hypothetical protein
MNPKLRKFLEQNGLRAAASEQEAWELFDKLKSAGIELIGVDPGQRSDVGGKKGTGPADDGKQPAATEPQDGKRSYSKEEIDNLIASQTVQALANDASRRNDVQNMIDVAGVAGLDNGDFARGLIDNPKVDAARASQLILTELQKRNTPIGIGAQVGVEAGEKSRAAITDGLLLRSGHRLEKPADGAREFRGRSLIEICRSLLEMNGVNCRNMSRMDIAGRALASGSTSDFPQIFSALVNKTLLAAYAEWPSTWRPFVAVVGANDFKDMHAIKLSGSPDLKGLNENGEYQTAKFSDAKEAYRVITKGIRVALTREMIINDDLRAFTRIPQLFGVAAKRMESDAVYSLITANGAMSDNIALFHGDHNNLGSAVALGSEGLSAGRAAMRMQKGLNGERIDATPAFLLAPVGLETTADILLRSAALPTAEMSSGVVNPWAGKLTPITDPHLDDTSETAWYLLAHPNQVPTIEVAYLEGEEQPYVEEMLDFNSDNLIVKVRHDFGAGVVDYVGAHMNPGA